jgi:hypothetical protein
MSQSKATRARRAASIDRQLVKKPPLSDSLKAAIADVVRGFDLSGLDGGSCAMRALLGQETLRACHLRSKMVPGAMLYGAGSNQMRDTLSFCVAENRGGYHNGYFVGHIWNELGDDLLDFSSGDWVQEATIIYAAQSQFDPVEQALGPVQWVAIPPSFIWQPAIPLKRAWQSSGSPAVGRAWYNDWSPRLKWPDLSGYDAILKTALPHIVEHIADIRLVERIAERSCFDLTDGI